MKLTTKKAFELSILKWELVVKNGKGTSYPNEIRVLNANCGLCEKFVKTNSKTHSNCAKCPIRPKDRIWSDNLGCFHHNHLWNIWRNDYTTENAQAVLDLIEEKYNKYLKK